MHALPIYTCTAFPIPFPYKVINLSYNAVKGYRTIVSADFEVKAAQKLERLDERDCMVLRITLIMLIVIPFKAVFALSFYCIINLSSCLLGRADTKLRKHLFPQV